MKYLNHKPAYLVALFQSLGLLAYISLVAIIFWKGNAWFGKDLGYLAPLMMISLFSLSALTCAIITLAYPFYLAWEKHESKKAIQVVIFTAFFLFFYFLTIFLVVIL